MLTLSIKTLGEHANTVYQASGSACSHSFRPLYQHAKAPKQAVYWTQTSASLWLHPTQGVPIRPLLTVNKRNRLSWCSTTSLIACRKPRGGRRQTLMSFLTKRLTLQEHPLISDHTGYIVNLLTSHCLKLAKCLVYRNPLQGFGKYEE